MVGIWSVSHEKYNAQVKKGTDTIGLQIKK